MRLQNFPAALAQFPVPDVPVNQQLWRCWFLGGTGKTGLHLVQQLLARGFQVKAIVRSPEKLPVDVARHSGLTVITAKVLDLTDEAIVEHLTGLYRCDQLPRT